MDTTLLRLGLVLLLVVVTVVVGRLVAARRARLHLLDGSNTLTAVVLPDRSSTPSGPSAVLFGSPTCAPCATLKQLLRDVESTRGDFSWRYVDAADHLDEARAQGVRTVPTLLVLDAGGGVVARTSGIPRRSELEDAVDRAAVDDRGAAARSA